MRCTLPIVWVVGGPGSGKGTQCEKVVEEFKFTHLSTGELLRQEVDKDTELGKIIKEIMDKGELVPTEIVLDLLIQAMEKVSTESKGYLIDGYPRTEDQGPAFEKKIGSPDAVMYIECKPETMLQRCLDRGREDDTVEIITERIRIFYENFAIIEKQYPEKIRKINGEGTPDEVYVDVAKLIREILANKQKS